MTSFSIQFNVLLTEEELLRELQEFITSTDWDEFQSIVERESGPGLSEQLEGMRVVDVGVNSLQTGTEEGALEGQRRQKDEPSFVAELRVSLPVLPTGSFQTGKILAPDIEFLARVSTAMSIAVDDKDVNDFTVLRVTEESRESRVLVDSGGEVTVHVLVDCRTPEEATKVAAVLQDLPSAELQKAFEEMIEEIGEVVVVGVVPLYEVPESETPSLESEAPPPESSSKSVSKSRGLEFQTFVAFSIVAFLC